VLIALLLPAIQKVREAANRTQCQNNLKQLGLALHNYHNAMLSFPQGQAASQGSWQTFILPFFEQDGLYKAIRNSPATSHVDNSQTPPVVQDPAGSPSAASVAGILPVKLSNLRCPSDYWEADNPRLSNYATSAGPQCDPAGGC